MDPQKQEIIERLQELYKSIPESLQKAIMSSDYQRKLIDIARENKLNIEQLGTLELVTTFVMLGATSPNNYMSELQEKLGIGDKTVLEKIVDQVNTQIFAAIREELQEINELDNDATDEPEAVKFTEAEMAEGGFTQQESETLKKSGIEIEPPKSVSQASPAQTASAPTSPLQSRANILNGIENPTSGKPSFVKEQLSGTFSLPKKETTYTPVAPSAIPNPPTPKPASNEAPVKDPYREAV